jgi:hypothetical protein
MSIPNDGGIEREKLQFFVLKIFRAGYDFFAYNFSRCDFFLTALVKN